MFVKSHRYGYGVQRIFLKNGDVTFYAVYKNEGKKIRVKVGRKSEGITEAKAYEYRSKLISDDRHGIDMTLKANKKSVTIDQIAERYFDFGDIHIKSIKKYKQQFKRHIAPNIGGMPLMSLGDDDIVALQRLLQKEELSDATNNQVIKLIKQIVAFGVKNRYITTSPFRNVRMLKLNNARERYLSVEEIHRLLHHTHDETAQTFIQFALSTGARANAVLAIQKQHIDYENRTVLVQDHKSNKPYTAYLNDFCINYIADFYPKLSPTTYIIGRGKSPVKYTTLRYRIKEAIDLLNEGIDPKDRKNKAVIHTLRHTFLSHLAIDGASALILQKLGNHADIRQTKRYAKLAPNSGQSQVERLYHR